MNRRPVVVVKTRGLFRRTPEQILIDQEEGDLRLGAARAERACPEEVALIAALETFAAAVGWPTARTWLAARSHEKPDAAKRVNLAVADRSFRRRVA